jgi:pyrroline-5-carboxylate reductase
MKRSFARIAVLGAGKMGESLIAGLLDVGLVKRGQIVATARHEERLETLSQRLGIETTLDNRKAIKGASLVILAVKPQSMAEVLKAIGGRVTGQQLVISVAASVSTSSIEKSLKVRARGRHALDGHVEAARRVFDPLGLCMTLDERHMDAVTGLSASGPAYLYVVIESLAEGGVKMGLPRDVATTLAAQMVLGSAAMVLDSGEHPAKLKDVVTTPAGCTIDGLLELEEGGLRVTLIKAVVRASDRAGELIHD